MEYKNDKCEFTAFVKAGLDSKEQENIEICIERVTKTVKEDFLNARARLYKDEVKNDAEVMTAFRRLSVICNENVQQCYECPVSKYCNTYIENARKNVAQQVNTQLLTTYWNIGRIIVEYEQQNQIRADYGKQTLRELSKELTREFGKGFSRSNLQNMRAFYLAYEKCQTVSGKLSWSHYCELLNITDENKRSFYEKESINSGWSVRELKRQIDSSLYERLLLSSGDANKEKVLSLAQKGIEINQPADIIRDPYVFEFLGVPENKPILESDLEKALVVQIEKFLLELGRGFMFVGTQQRVTLNNTHYYVDMVFYNKILRAYVLIELKTKKLTPEAAGQLNMYLNYYAAEVNDPDDNPPIGIILCTEKDSIAAEYALGGLSNNIFASRYVLYMPDKEQLIAQVEAVLKNWHDKKDNCHD